MSDGTFLGLMIWLHLAFVLIPGIAIAMKYEWDDFKKSHPSLPITYHDNLTEFRHAS